MTPDPPIWLLITAATASSGMVIITSVKRIRIDSVRAAVVAGHRADDRADHGAHDADDEGDDQRLLQAAHGQREVVATLVALTERMVTPGRREHRQRRRAAVGQGRFEVGVVVRPPARDRPEPDRGEGEQDDQAEHDQAGPGRLVPEEAPRDDPELGLGGHRPDRRRAETRLRRARCRRRRNWPSRVPSPGRPARPAPVLLGVGPKLSKS